MEQENNQSPSQSRTDACSSNEKSTATTPATQVSNPRRRRGLGTVTPNACRECRKKRTKCDGQEPCSRCKSLGDIECVYETPVRHTKDDLRAEIEELRQHQGSSSRVISALVRPDLSQDILRRLWSGQSIEGISKWVENSDVVTVPSRTSPNRQDNAPRKQVVANNATPMRPSHPDSLTMVPKVLPIRTSPGDDTSRERNSILWPLGEPATSFSGSWTTVTSDMKLVQHLLALYFCWEYPTFASLSKEHFLRDFHDGKPRFCSSLLTNALLALGCRFSNHAETKKDSNDDGTLGDHFFKECQRLYLGEADHHSLTTIQATGIMAIREASCGRVSRSGYYAGQCMRLAIEMDLHRFRGRGGKDDDDDGEDGEDEDKDHCAVRLATFWGAFALDNALSFAGSLPRTSCQPLLPPKLPTVDVVEQHPWIPYTDDGVPLQLPCEQPSNERSVFNCFCQLGELAHQSLYVIHNPSRPLTANSLLQVYTSYLVWYDKLPAALRLGHNFTPYVLFVHMYYHFSIFQLFWPVAKLSILGTELSPRELCVQAADAISALLKSYARLYTLQRTPSFVPCFAVTAAIVHLLVTSDCSDMSIDGKESASATDRGQAARSSAAEALEQDVAALTEMTECHLFAKKALGIVAQLAEKWHVNVNIEPREVSPQDCIEICWLYNRSIQCGPPLGISDKDVVAGVDGDASWQQGRSRMAETTLDSVLHPLFWPLLDLRKPTPTTPEDLERAGFTLI